MAKHFAAAGAGGAHTASAEKTREVAAVAGGEGAASGVGGTARSGVGGAARGGAAGGAGGAHAAAPGGGAPKKRPSRVRRVLSVVLFVLGMALIGIAGYLWWDAQSAYSAQDQVNERLQSYAVTPSNTVEEPPTIDWEGLAAVNSDVCGWIYIPGTVINYPVYQGKDNDYYLNTTAEGVYGVGGQIFIDYETTNPGMVDEQTVIYGHHLNNGTMFKQVADMDDQATFDSITTVWYCTPEQNYLLKPLLCYHTTGTDTTVRQFMWPTLADFRTYLTDKLAIAQAAASDAAEVIAQTEHVLTLSTCNYIAGSGRTILICAPVTQ
jgi:sortase B